MPQFDKNTPTAFQNNAEDKQREIAARGGVASGEAKRRKKTLREELEIMLEALVKKDDGKEVSLQHELTGAVLQKGLQGDVRAFEVIRDTIGQKPIDKQEISTGDGGFVVQFKKSLDNPIEADEWEKILAERASKNGNRDN